MRDVDEMLRALETPRAPREPPEWPGDRRWRVGLRAAAVVAVALGVLLVVLAPRPALRGTAALPPTLDLRMVIVRGGVAMRIAEGSRVQVGERVLFRVSADRPTPARLWVEGPVGSELVAAVELDRTPVDVGDGTGLVGYRFDGVGRYVFHLTPEAGSCASCPVIPVEVR